jgi:Chaperone of endosialidase
MKSKVPSFIIIMLVILLFNGVKLYSQNIAITDDDGYSASSAAMLDVKSTTKGLLIPRVALVSTTDPISVTKPNGLLVWNTSVAGTYDSPGYYFWNGSNWEMVGSNNVFSNGLTQTENSVKLGGSLSESTTITQGVHDMTFDLTSTGVFDIQDNGTSALYVKEDGNVGIGTTTPNEKLHVNGNIDVEGNVTITDNVLIEGSTDYRVYSNLASYSSDGGTGAIVINTNQPMQTSMFRIKVEGSCYSTVGPFDITIKAYASASSFYNSGYTTVSPDVYDITLAENSSTGNIAVIIGTTSTSFSYPKITVTQFAQGYMTLDDSYADGWTISLESNLSGYQSQVTVPNVTALDLSDYSTAAEVAAAIDAVDFFDRVGSHITQEDTTDNISIGTATETGKFLVQGTSSIVDTAIFEVKNKDGQTVFAVYPEGVRVYVDDSPSKAVGNKGGFAVGGFDSGKGGNNFTDDYLIISRDSARVFYDADPAVKAVGNKGGFAVGGFDSGKSVPTNFLDLSPLNYFIGHESGSSIQTGGDYNTFFGYQAGMDNTLGTNNIFIGYKSGFDNITGASNTFLGNQSGYYNETGSYNTYIGFKSGYESGLGTSEVAQYNTFVGYQAGIQNRNGDNNVFIGYNAGYDNSDASNNIFIGTSSGANNTTGSNNIFLGNLSGLNNATGSNNLFMGYRTGYYSGWAVTTDPSFNTFIGYQAGFRNQEGGYNTYLGYEAGYSGTYGDGDNNVYLGHRSGYSNTTGHDNVFIGKSAGYDNTSGSKNVFLGLEAGANNTTGYSNIFLGYKAGDDNTTGYKNTIIGEEAGQFNISGDENVMLGYKAGYWGKGNRNVYIGCNTATIGGTGNDNVYVGYKSGEGWFGTGNVLIGPYTGYQHPDVLDPANNQLCIGNSASWPPLIAGDFTTKNVAINGTPRTDAAFYAFESQGSAYAGYFFNDGGFTPRWGIGIQCGNDGGTSSNYMIRFHDGNGTYHGAVELDDGTIEFVQSSDKRLKENIKDTELNALGIVNNLRVADFNFIEGSKSKQTGFIAQEVEKVFPDMSSYDEHSDTYGISMTTLIPVLTKAIQEQQELIKKLEQRIEQLERKGTDN